MKLKYTFKMMELGDHTIAVPVGENSQDFHGVVKLNESAASIFKLLQNSTTEEAIVDSLAKEYDTSKDSLDSAVHKLVSELKQKNLLDE